MTMMAEMVELKPGRVLPNATSRVYINPDRQRLGFGTQQTDAARNLAVIRGMQTIGYLENEFHGNVTAEAKPSATPRFVNKSLRNGCRVAMVGSDVGYFATNGVIVATDLPQLDPDELVRRQDELVTSQLPRHLNDSLRIAYTAAILATLYTADQQATETQIPIAIQHLTDVRSQHVKSPRSIPRPHATVGAYDLRTFFPGVKKSDHLIAEQSVVDLDYNELLALSLYGYINAALQGTEFEEREFEVRPRYVEPFGYEMSLDVPTNQLLTADNIRFVSTMMDLQHDGYWAFYQQYGTNRPLHIVVGDKNVYRRKPQPSRRNYLVIGPDELQIIDSPIEYSHSGAFEAAGAVLLRSPKFEPLEEPESIYTFRKSAAAEIERAIDVVSFI